MPCMVWMEMTVIAEGIETAQQLAQLRELNCNFGQSLEAEKMVEANTIKF